MVEKKIRELLSLSLLLPNTLVLILVFACSTTKDSSLSSVAGEKKTPKNIILMIGDGMGLSQVSAAMYSSKRPLNLEKFQYLGFHKSYAATELVTDSAAGATAFACGIKTYNGSIGMSMDSIPHRTILEEAEAQGIATGLVATCFIVHATPASFYAHQELRTMNEEIALDLVDKDIDLVIGGGKKYFDRREQDNRNLYKELEEKGYQISDYSKLDLTQVDFNTRSKVIHFTADRHPVPVSAGRNYLPYASKAAPRFLRNYNDDKGFFLMIEGSQIDWAGHGNEGDLMIEEVLDFDRAIGEALRFAQSDGNTLVIVTADHETGGLAINPGSSRGDIKTAFTTNGHTAALVPVYAYGPGAEDFQGIYENTAIYYKMKKLLGLETTDVATEMNAGDRE